MLTSIKDYMLAGTGLVAAGLLVGLVVTINSRNEWRDDYRTLSEQADKVVIALKQATDDNDVTWKTAAEHIAALGDSNRSLKRAIVSQNERIDEMARDAVRMKAQAAELKLIADRAQAQRQAAVTKLSDMAISPGTRGDCETLLREADAALNLVRSAGL